MKPTGFAYKLLSQVKGQPLVFNHITLSSLTSSLVFPLCSVINGQTFSKIWPHYLDRLLSCSCDIGSDKLVASAIANYPPPGVLGFNRSSSCVYDFKGGMNFPTLGPTHGMHRYHNLVPSWQRVQSYLHWMLSTQAWPDILQATMEYICPTLLWRVQRDAGLCHCHGRWTCAAQSKLHLLGLTHMIHFEVCH
jgi:hypothetical protein